MIVAGKILTLFLILNIDFNLFIRMIKYTPLHDFCYAIFYGPFSNQNTGVIATQTIQSNVAKFRIAATGIVLENNKTF